MAPAREGSTPLPLRQRRRWLLGLSGALGLAVAAAAFAQWSAGREAERIARALTGGEPARAPVLITRYGCGGCHAIPGAPGADGRVAGPLAGLRERVYLGGVLRNTPENLVAWMVNPRAFSPRTAMPATGITEAEARDVAAWLYAH
ncbi:cytochrome C [Pseudoroseomonas wenyumeiae]|uniref:Cytochrome C n=2 Tax=Teichococcus wenyumeiae TaxID=2478470 RepID=A0A3A9JXM2_9PROT|nr:cytochrome C [Pseudoroseomonas wenyumeiae]RMI20778.1 cytochrome C [Pseudoroseomonas wenyumeiae]